MVSIYKSLENYYNNKYRDVGIMPCRTLLISPSEVFRHLDKTRSKINKASFIIPKPQCELLSLDLEPVKKGVSDAIKSTVRNYER